MKTQDDSFLLSAIAHQRDHDAFAELFERYQRRAYSVAFHILRNSALAEDAVQEAMLSIWSDTRREIPRDPNDWILRIVMNKSISLLRQKLRSAKRDTQTAAQQSRIQTDTAEDVESKEMIAGLRTQLNQLPDLERMLLACSYCTSMSHREIAKLVGVSHPTVSQRIRQALELLRSQLKTAGLAAALPLLSHENLVEALTTSQTYPPDMTQSMLERIANSRQSERLLPRRAKPVWFGGMALPAALIAITVAGAVALYVRQQPGTVTGSDGSAVKNTLSDDKPSILDRRWAFEKGAPEDITVRVGQWNWEATPRGGRMITDEKVVLLLPHPLPNKPLQLTCKNLFRDGAVLGAMWSDGDSSLSYTSWKKPNLSFKTGSQFEIRWYCVGSFTYIFRGSELIALADFGHRADYLCLLMGHSEVEELTLKEIGESDYPPELRETPQALTARMGWSPIESASSPFLPHKSSAR